MVVIAHAGHWMLGALEAAPLLIVLAVVVWRICVERSRPGGDRAATRSAPAVVAQEPRAVAREHSRHHA